MIGISVESGNILAFSRLTNTKIARGADGGARETGNSTSEFMNKNERIIRDYVTVRFRKFFLSFCFFFFSSGNVESVEGAFKAPADSIRDT